MINISRFSFKKKPTEWKAFTPIAKFPVVDRKISTEEMMKIIQRRTPKDFVKEVAKNGRNLRYVLAYYMIDALNGLTNYQWSAKPLKTYFSQDKKELLTDIEFVAQLPNGSRVNHFQTGSSEFKEADSEGETVKASITDGVKKCCSYLSICWDIYSGNGESLEGISLGNEPLTRSEREIIQSLIERSFPEDKKDEIVKHLDSDEINRSNFVPSVQRIIDIKEDHK